MDYIAPGFRKNVFSCPHCSVVGRMWWEQLLIRNLTSTAASDIWTADCPNPECSKKSIWRAETHVQEMIWPTDAAAAEPAHDAMPTAIRADYEEARSIVAKSPRGAAALLRLVVQKLCVELGESGENLNNDIGALVEKGLSRRIQKALDVVRVIGNNAVHPGEIRVEDDPSTAASLFRLVNLIVENQIAEPASIDALFEALPAAAKVGITKRDKG